LSARIGAEFGGRIAGVQRFGLFVKLDETGADGLVPIRSIGREFFHFDADEQVLIGSDTGVRLGLGQRVTVRLAEASPITGGIMLDLLMLEGKTLPTGMQRRKFAPRKPAKAAIKADKIARKVERKRR
jgi:ribonuclease R